MLHNLVHVSTFLVGNRVTSKPSPEFQELIDSLLKKNPDER